MMVNIVEVTHRCEAKGALSGNVQAPSIVV